MEHTKIIAAISLVLGLLLLLTSSLFLDDWREAQKVCPSPDICKPLNFYITAASLGIVAAIVQIGSFPVAYLRKWKLWYLLHIATFLLSLVAFSLAMDQEANKLPDVPGFRDFGSRAKAFLAFACIDAFYSLITVGIMFYLTRNYVDHEML